MSIKESFQNSFFCLLFVKSEGHKLEELFSCDLADCGFVNENGIGMFSDDRGDRADLRLTHNDRVAFDVTEAFCSTRHLRIEYLNRIVGSNASRENSAVCPLALEDDLHIGASGLIAVCHKLFVDDHLGILTDDDLGVALGRVTPLICVVSKVTDEPSPT